MKTTSSIVGIAFSALLLCQGTAHAQAWAGYKGDLTLTLSSAFQFSDGVFWGELGKVTGLSAQSLRSTLGAEYNIINQLAVGATLTGQFDRYTGPLVSPNPAIVFAHGENDDGDWHASISDLNLETRYQFLMNPLAMSAVLRAKIPASGYEPSGYAASGNGLVEVGGGIYAGRYSLGALDKVFVQGGYTFTWVQAEEGEPDSDLTEQYRTHHSDVSAQGGYVFTDEIYAALILDFRWTHDGFMLPDYPNSVDELKYYHDPILARRYFAVGLAGNYAFSDELGLTAAASVVAWGDNVSDAKTFTVNVSWTRFGEP